MQKSELEAPVVALMAGVEFRGEVFFDPDIIMLEGRYSDELSAHRARRSWVKIFEASFLLEPEHDFLLTVSLMTDEEGFALRCSFVSACGRYAFWRLTHGQAQDAQYLLETAHVPSSLNNSAMLVGAPDLRRVQSRSVVGIESSGSSESALKHGSMLRWISRPRLALKRFLRQLSG